MKYITRNVKFDNSYSNAILFNSLQDRLDYFNIPSDYSSINSPEINFNFGNLLNTTLVLRDNNAYGVLSLLNYNYIILIEEVDETPYKYLFYFINEIKYDTSFQATLTLELDVLNTFSLYDLEFSPCIIHRTHLDRYIWNKASSLEVYQGSLNLNDYDIYNEELTSYSKVLTKRSHLKVNWTGNEDIDEWLNNYVAYWVYCFVDKSHNYKELNSYQTSTDSGSMIIDMASIIDPNREYGCFCYPMTKNGGKIRFKNGFTSTTEYVEINYHGEQGFRDLNNDTSYYYSKKFSIVPPHIEWLKNGSINENTLTLTYFTTVSTWTYYNSHLSCGVITHISENVTDYETENYETEFNNYIIVTSPLKYYRDMGLEPKLYSNLIKEINICYQGNTFTYDPLKIGSNIFNFKYNEVLSPEITKIYYRLSGNNNLYINETSNNYLGLVASVDNSLPYANDQYAEYLANNKNYWLQTAMKVGSNVIQGKLQTIASGNSSATVSSLIGGAASLVNAGLKADNMRNAPDSLTNANGSYLFSISTNNYDLVVEEYEALEDDKQKAYDYLYRYGYMFEKIGNIKDHIDTRYYFNYISADIENIYYYNNLSLPIRNKIKLIFKNGVRLWHYHSKYADRLFDYTYENWEKTLIDLSGE